MPDKLKPTQNKITKALNTRRMVSQNVICNYFGKGLFEVKIEHNNIFCFIQMSFVPHSPLGKNLAGASLAQA